MSNKPSLSSGIPASNKSNNSKRPPGTSTYRIQKVQKRFPKLTAGNGRLGEYSLRVSTASRIISCQKKKDLHTDGLTVTVFSREV